MRSVLTALVFVASVHEISLGQEVALSSIEPKTFMTQRGKLLFADDFSKPLTKEWRVGKGNWSTVEGALRGAELPADTHAAVVRRGQDFHDSVLQVDFKLDGAKQTTLSFNAAKGHVCRVLIHSGGFAVKKDSSDHNKTNKGQELDRVITAIKPGIWHTLLVEIHGKEMLACLDGKDIAYGSHPGIDIPLANVGLTVAKEAVAFRNFRLWEASPNPNWAETRTRILMDRKKTPAPKSNP